MEVLKDLFILCFEDLIYLIYVIKFYECFMEVVEDMIEVYCFS